MLNKTHKIKELFTKAGLVIGIGILMAVAMMPPVVGTVASAAGGITSVNSNCQADSYKVNGTCPKCTSSNPSSNCACKNTVVQGKTVNNCTNNAVTCTGQNCDLIIKYVNPAIDLFSVLFGLIAVGSLILGGINYSASGGDPQKAAQAKSRITNTIVAVIAYMLLYSFLQFIVPGGAFNR